MTIDDPSLNISEVDFSTIKQNLINFLKQQDEFSDYVFDGSTMNILLDILSYSTAYNAVYTNLGFAETFLDSAVLRGNVVSRSKELGYVPRSKTSASADIKLSFVVEGNPEQYILPANTNFSASDGTTTYTFTTTHDCTFTNDSNNVFSNTIKINQGVLTTYTYVVDNSNPLQRFIIPDKNVDLNFLSVSYTTSNSGGLAIPVSYFKDLEISQLAPTTDVFFLNETIDGYFEVYFGDDVIGRDMKNGNVITLYYLITDADKANNLRLFSFASTIPVLSSINISTVNSSSGGQDIESTDSIKYLAPFYYQAQNRAVTEDDYKALIKNRYGGIDDIVVWGGEKNNPPFYGRVFIAMKPTDGTAFSEDTKLSIVNDIQKSFNVVSIIPEIVDPDYIFVFVNSTITYSNKLYSRNSNINLEGNITTTINNFFSSSVNKFGSNLYYSQLSNAIDNVSPIILNNITDLKLMKQVEIFSGIAGQYTFNYNNAIHPGSVLSNSFIIDGITWQIKDVPDNVETETTGKLVVFRTTNQGQILYLNQNAGIVDYNAGTIKITSLRIDAILNDPFEKLLQITVSMGAFNDVSDQTKVVTDYNVYTNKLNQIIVLADAGINLTLIADNSK